MYVKEINTPFGLLNPHISQLNFFLPVRSLRHHPTLSRVKPKNGHKNVPLTTWGPRCRVQAAGKEKSG